MPTIVALPDGREVEVPDDASPEQRAALKTKLRERYTAEQDGPLERAGSYIAKRGKSFLGALNRLTGLPGQADPSVGQVASDVLEVGGPVIAPGLSAAGAVAGAGARALGASDETAQMVDAGTALVGGVGQAAKAAWKGGAAAADVVPEGRALQRAVPGMRGATAAERGRLFDPILETMRRSGRTLKTGTPEGDKLGQALLDAQDDWGMLAGAGEKRVVQSILDKLTSGAAVSVDDIDDGLKVLNRSGKAYSTRRALVDGLNDIAAGTPAAGKLTEAGRQYHELVKPGQWLAKQIGNAPTPADAANRAINGWMKMGEDTRKLVDPTGEIGQTIAQAARSRPRGGQVTGWLVGTGAAGSLSVGLYRLSQGDIGGGLGAILGTGAVLGLRYPGMAKAALGATPEPMARGAAAAGSAAVSGDAPETAAEPRTAPQSPAQRPQGQPEAKAAPEASYPFQREIETVAKVVGVPSDFLRVVITKESAGQPRAVSKPTADQVQTPAHGLMQVTPGTFKGVAGQVEALTGRPASLSDPLDNLIAGALLYKGYLDQTGGDVAAAGRLYHGGANTRYHGPKTRAYGDDLARRYAAVGGGG
jgi:hypothetical protein